jgi:hypothetical protein
MPFKKPCGRVAHTLYRQKFPPATSKI